MRLADERTRSAPTLPNRPQAAARRPGGRKPVNYRPLLIRLAGLATIAVGLLPARAAPLLPGQEPNVGNPILPGYFADPSIVEDGGKHYIYATMDPWGGESLGCWESADFRNWTFRVLNWPTKQACTSPESAGSMVWAPSVARAPGGGFVMYISVGSEVWVGKAPHPLGPWQDANQGKPIIPRNFMPGYHMIDAEIFLDDDGTGYLYWGSGLNWVNGKCWVVKLTPDLVSFAGEPKEVTPANYFEAPVMVKNAGRYHLMYSNGKTIEDSYQIHVATGDSPMGPFTESPHSPILVTDMPRNIRAPGHHAVFTRDGRLHLLYHRHNIPFDGKFIGRQTCVDPLVFGPDAHLQKVAPSHRGPDFIQRAAPDFPKGSRCTASSQRNDQTRPEFAFDNNHATLWAAADAKDEQWLQWELPEATAFSGHRIRFEYPQQPMTFRLEISSDGASWQTVATHAAGLPVGSPRVMPATPAAKFLRLVFPANNPAVPAIFEWIPVP